MTESVAIANWILLAGSLGACAVLMVLVERLYRRVERLERHGTSS